MSLANLLVNPTYIGIPESLLYAVLGFFVVFVGIAFLIFVVWLVGLIMAKFNGVKTVAKVVPEKTKKDEVIPSTENEVDDETVAVITAAIMAYYQANNPKCEFVVKRIKRI